MQRKTQLGLIFGFAALIAAFMLGFVPQYRRSSELERQVQAQQERLSIFERGASLSRARDLASQTYLEATRKNYGLASQRATEFFNQVETLARDADSPSRRQALEAIATQRDTIIAGLSSADPIVEQQLRDLLDRIHQIPQA